MIMAGEPLELGKEYPPQGEEAQIEEILTISKLSMQHKPLPVEDPTVEWDEQESPYVKVATIRIPSQNFNTEERKQFDEKQSFSPWHTLPEHQPLGGVNRARKRIYGELAKFRNDRNQSDM